MKLAYFDCFSGISGDMIIGALLDAGLAFDTLKAEIDKLNLPNVELQHRKVSKVNIAATKFNVNSSEKTAHRHLKDLNKIVEEAELADDVKTKAKAVFLKIAEAEAKIHNQSLEKVHFHEIGAVDTIVDVVGALVGLKLLGVEQVACSKLNVGTGFVEFSHGKFPVPAPATAEILKGIPTYATDSQAELVTPTGAAIMATVATQFGEIPTLQTDAIGYGAGTRDLEHPNVLRVMIGEAAEITNAQSDTVAILETNIDDMNPQLYDNLIERLLEEGALDVILTNVAMKKNRPALQVTVLATPGEERKIASILFSETTTLGVRLRHERRLKLDRETKTVKTEFGPVQFKIAKLKDDVLNVAPEYEACKRIAREQKLPLKVIYEKLSKIRI